MNSALRGVKRRTEFVVARTRGTSHAAARVRIYTRPVPFREAARSVSFRLICLLVVGHLAFSGDRFMLTLQAVALKASPLAIGVLMSLLMVVPMVLSIHMGRWADRLGFARPAAAGLVMLALANVLAGLAPTMSMLYVASVFIGSGYTLAHVAVNNAVGQLAPARQLTRSFSMLALGFSTSGMTGPLIAGFVIDHLGHPAAFFGMLGFALIRWPCWCRWCAPQDRCKWPKPPPHLRASPGCCGSGRCARPDRERTVGDGLGHVRVPGTAARCACRPERHLKRLADGCLRRGYICDPADAAAGHRPHDGVAHPQLGVA